VDKKSSIYISKYPFPVIMLQLLFLKAVLYKLICIFIAKLFDLY